MFGRKRGLGDSGTKPGTELAWAVDGPEQSGQGWGANGGSGPYVGPAPSHQGFPGLTPAPSSLTYTVGAVGPLGFMVVHWVPRSLFGSEVGKTRVQNTKSRVRWREH